MVRALVFISWIVPRRAWVKFFGLLGRLSFFVARKSRRRAFENLSMAFGNEKSEKEIFKLSRKVYEMLGKNGGEVLRGFAINSQEALDKIRRVNGIEHFEAAHKPGKGVLLLTAHLGAFEFVATELATRGYNPLIVVKRLKDARLNDLLLQQRNRAGAQVVPRGEDTIRLIRSLKSGGTVIILIDQDTKVKSRFVNFFGTPCATPIGATVLALRTGAAVVPMFIHLCEDYMHEINCYPSVTMEVTGDEERDLIVNTQKLSDVVEKEVRRYPEQWVWMHQRWKTKHGKEIR